MHNNNAYKYVNGPLNAVRIEGEIYGIKKVLYIFMDVHVSVQYQTHCKDFDSIELVYYIIKMLKSSDKKKVFDLFTETTETNISVPEIPFRGRYIDEINKYLKHEYKNKKSSLNNIRAHYIDVRDHIKNTVNELFGNSYYIIKRSPYASYMNRSEYDDVKHNIENLIAMLKIIKDLMLGKTPNEKTQFNIDELSKIIHKILTKYNHPDTLMSFVELKNKINDQFETLLKMLNDMIIVMNEYETHIFKNPHTLFLNERQYYKVYRYGIDNEKYNEFIYKLNSLFDDFDVVCTHTFASIVDIYFLRRFIDKDYITNGIVYTGASHSVYYIYHLIKFYDFKITHISDSSKKSLDEIHKIIKNNNYSPELERLFFPSTLIQCVNVNDFPIGFE